jgi:ABC-type glycerol-3-phosphate transport system substrate-binding protein
MDDTPRQPPIGRPAPGPLPRPQASRRALFLPALAALVAAPALACGEQGGGPGAPAPAPSRAVTGKVLVLSYQTSSPRVDVQAALYDDFNREYKPKGLEVEFVNPGQSVIEKVIPMHVAGTPADVWEWPRLWRELEGVIADLSSMLRRDKIDLGQWIPESIAALKQGDKVWGTPVSISADALAVNLDLFDAAGVPPPPQDPDDRSWTMDKFLETSRKLTKGTEQFGFGGSFTGGVAWMNGPPYFGYGPVDLQAQKITLNTPGFQQGLQFWADMATKHHLQPYGDEADRLRAAASQHIFTTGKIGTAVIFNLAERPGFRWAIAALPYTPSPQQPRNVSARISVHALFVDSDSKNKDQAWEVLKYWMVPEHDAKYVLSDGHVVSPLLKGAFDLTAKDFQERMGADPRAYFLQAQRSKVDGWHFYLLKDWAKARTEIDPLWTNATNGQMAVGEFATQAQAISERLASF